MVIDYINTDNGVYEHIRCHQPKYEDRVVELIRNKYSVDDELSLLRQRDENTEDFNKYKEYCDECKIIAKKETE